MHLRRFGRLATFAGIWTFLLIVFGGIVRITGSGMGCGDHWPKCNGSWIPPFTLETLIEYTHRVLGVSIGLILIGVFLYALKHRNEPGFSGRDGVLRYAAVVLVLVVVQGLLGAITVWFEIPPAVVVVHFATALTIMAILLAAGVTAKAGSQSSRSAGGQVGPTVVGQTLDERRARLVAFFVFATVVFGALTANNLGAPQACQGFPLCNGGLLPRGGSLVHIQWTHRFLAYVTFFIVLVQAQRAWRGGGSTKLRRTALAAALIVTLQVVVAAGLILMHLPRGMQAMHLAVGALLWAHAVLWYSHARNHYST
ncbi:MAG TPA: COX15/CtaA family protein [Longimicrobiales bacterium]|nr:COX15/CtaA family protein [Longimicrobiales bacterium]